MHCRSHDHGDSEGKGGEEDRGTELAVLQGTLPQVAWEHAGNKDEKASEKQEANADKENGVEQALCSHGGWLILGLLDRQNYVFGVEGQNSASSCHRQVRSNRLRPRRQHRPGELFGQSEGLLESECRKGIASGSVKL